MPGLDALRGVPLEVVEERAALQRRVDTKFLIARADLDVLLARLGEDYDVLEIDGLRAFRYRTVYFDSPGLRCFHDHVDGVRPRFKVRTRCYLDAGECQFEVKVKTREDETAKRQSEHPAGEPERLGDEGRRLVDETLEACGAAPEHLEAVLATEFRRVTLAAREGGARITCDLGLRLLRPDGAAATLDDRLALLETKSEDGGVRVHDLLAELGHEPVSLSKYRIGIDLLVERDPTGDTEPLRGHFGVLPPA